MGRAIDMENDIQKLTVRVKKLEDVTRGMTHSIDEMSEKSTKTKHIDLVDDVNEEESDDGKKKANNKGSGKSGRASKKSNGNSKNANNKHGNSDS